MREERVSERRSVSFQKRQKQQQQLAASFNNILVQLTTTTTLERCVADGRFLLIELGIHLKATQIDQYCVVCN